MTLITTCQICARPIKTTAKSVRHSRTTRRGTVDVIAHHGYTRPGAGWGQTASCFGARWRPYEVACDALPLAIANCEKWVASIQAAYDADRANPPATLEGDASRGSFGPRKMVTYTRPDGYDGAAERGSWSPRTYDAEFQSLQSTRRRHISSGRESLRHMRERLAAWVAPSTNEAVA